MLLCMAVLLATMPMFNIITASAATYTGNCGDNLTWSYNTNTKELTISGMGNMYNYSYVWDSTAARNRTNAPWGIYYNSIEHVTIKKGVTNIGNFAFRDCISIKDVIIPNSVTSIGHYSFEDCFSISNITIPNSVTTIGDAAFNTCKSLTSIVIPYGVKEIRWAAFSYCSSLTNITIPNSVTSINSSAFSDCTSLSNITIPNSVTSICGHAFSGCTSLKSIIIPDSVTTIQNNMVFNKCTSLTVYGSAGSYAENYCKKNNILFMCINPLNTKPDAHYNYSEEVATSQEDINLDFSNANCDIDLGNISGPSINILGHKFDLINMKSEFNFDVEGVSASYKVDNTKKTVRVILGYSDDAKATIKEDSAYNKEYNDLKELYKYISGGNIKDWNGYQKLRSQKLSKIIDRSGSLGLSAKIKVTGYLEFSYETGEMIATESGIIIAGEIGVSLTYQPNFFYITTGLKGSADAAVGFALEQNGKISFKSLATNFKLSANIGVGIGSKALKIYGEGGLMGTIGVSLLSDFVNSANYKVNLTGSLYLEAKAVLFTYKKSWDFYNQDLINKTINLKSVNRNLFANPSETCMAVGRKYNFTNTQNTCIGSKALLRSSSQDNTVFSQNNIYPYAMPVYLNLNDGRSIVIWVGDDGTKTDNNRTSIIYSICENRIWSQPAVLQDDGTYNDMPCAYTDGENVYLIWQRAKNVFEDEIEVEQAVSQLDLYYSVFDGNAFSSPVCVTDFKNDVYEDTMSIFGTDGTQVISWRQNDENAIFEDTGNDSLYYRLCENGIWQEAVEVIATDDHIDEQVCTIENNIPVLYYIVTGETSTLHRYDTSTGITTQIACGENVNSLSVLNGKVYYLCDEYLFSYDGESIQVTDLQLSNYQLVTNGEKETLFTLCSAGLKNALYSCERNSNNESFGDLTLFADYDSNIRNYYAVIDSNGLTSVAVNSVAVNEENIQAGDDVYGSADLFITEKENYYDIGIDYFSYDSNDVFASNNIEFTYQITNSGNVSQNGFTAQLYRENGSLIKSEYVNCELEPGESETFSISYLLPENISKEKIALKIEVDNDNFVANNTTNTAIGLADVLFSDLSVYVGNNNTAVLRGYVRNNGYDSAEDVLVSVSRLIDGEKIEISSINVGVLGANQIKEFIIELPADMLMTDNPDVMNGLYLSAITSSEESILSNNDDKVVYDTLITGDYDGMTYSLYNNGELWFEGSGTLHYYETNNNPMILYEDIINSIKSDSPIANENLKFFAAPLAWENETSVKFMIKKYTIEEFGYENPYVVFSINGNNTTVANYESNENYYIFGFNDITVDQLNDEITATIYATYKDVVFSSISINSTALDFGKQGCDLNGDCAVDIRDLVRLKKILSGIPIPEKPNDAVDLDFNGTLDALDLTYLVKILLFS